MTHTCIVCGKKTETTLKATNSLITIEYGACGDHPTSEVMKKVRDFNEVLETLQFPFSLTRQEQVETAPPPFLQSSAPLRKCCGVNMVVKDREPLDHLIRIACPKCGYFKWVGDQVEKELQQEEGEPVGFQTACG